VLLGVADNSIIRSPQHGRPHHLLARVTTSPGLLCFHGNSGAVIGGYILMALARKGGKETWTQALQTTRG